MNFYEHKNYRFDIRPTITLTLENGIRNKLGGKFKVVKE